MSSGYVVWDRDPTADWSTQLCTFEIKPRWLRLSSKIVGFLRAQHEPMGDMFVSFFPLFSYLLHWGNNAINHVFKACRQISASSKQCKIIPWERRKALFFSLSTFFEVCLSKRFLRYIKISNTELYFSDLNTAIIFFLYFCARELYTAFSRTFQCEHVLTTEVCYLWHTSVYEFMCDKFKMLYGAVINSKAIMVWTYLISYDCVPVVLFFFFFF